MADREKVIKSLETCSDVYYGATGACSSCSFSQSKNCFAELVHQTIALLKEQEAVKLKCKERMGGFVTGLCPTCGTALNNIHNVKACGKCGQAVKWDG